MRGALTEANLVIVPIIKEELLTGKGETVVVILNEKGWVDLPCHYVRDLLVVKLQEVREGFGQQQPREGNAGDLRGYQRREVLTFLPLEVLTLLCHYFILLFLFLQLLASFSLILTLVFLAVGHPTSQALCGLHYAYELQFEEIVEFVSDHVFAAFIPSSFLNLDDFLDLRYELFLGLGEWLPRYSRLLLLHRTILEIDQHLNPIIVGLFQQSIGGADQETSVVALLESREKMEVLDVEGHRHEIVRTEGP